MTSLVTLLVVTLVPVDMWSRAQAGVPAAPVSDTSVPPTVTPDDIRFTRHTLREGDPRQVGLQPERITAVVAAAEAYLAPTPDHPTYPTYAGAVVLAAKDGVIVEHAAMGDAVRYSGVGPPPEREGMELPAEQRIPMRPDTLFDLASISKLFTTVAALQLVERGLIDLDAPVTEYIPEFGNNGKETITVRMLLTHTSGLPAFAPLWRDYPTPEARIAAVYASPLAPGATPGGQYIYSDLGLITLGKIVEEVTGRPLDEVVAASITEPLGMRDTGYRPDPALRYRIAATEDQTYAGRGMVWGEVHDENAWALGGVAGHAGVFSTAADLAILCQTLLNGGIWRGTRILRESTVRAMLVNYNAALEPSFPESDRGLGFELNKHWYMGPLASPVTFGHTGFTGTSIVIDPLSHSFLIFLTNRVHPAREWGSNNVARRAVAREFAEAMPVRPMIGRTAWRTEYVENSTVTLTAPLTRPARNGIASFWLWYDTEPSFDTLNIEVSSDGGTTWRTIPLRLTAAGRHWSSDGTLTGYGGRHWWHVYAELPTGTTQLRWSYQTDTNSEGRGVYVDGLVVVGRDGLLFHGEHGDFIADGWRESTT